MKDSTSASRTQEDFGPGRGGVFIDDAILHHPRLNPGEKLLLGLLENLSRKSGLAYAAIETYAERLGFGGSDEKRVETRTVRRLLRQLERAGLIVVDQRGGGRGKTWVYKIDLEARKRGQVVPLSEDRKEDKLSEKRGQVVRRKEDKLSEKRGQVVPQDNNEATGTAITGETTTTATAGAGAGSGSAVLAEKAKEGDGKLTSKMEQIRAALQDPRFKSDRMGAIALLLAVGLPNLVAHSYSKKHDYAKVRRAVALTLSRPTKNPAGLVRRALDEQWETVL